jgi:hypothetical protein
MKKMTLLAPLLLFALVIDGLQFLVSLAVAAIAIPTVAGGLTGAAAGAYVCQNFGSWVIAGCSAAGGTVLAVLGTFFDGAAVVTEPIGVAVGFAISICISFTLGTILVLLLFFTGTLNKKAAAMAYIGETLPFFGSFLPAWTTLVIRCGMSQTKKAVMGRAISGVFSFSQGVVLPNNTENDVQEQGTLLDMGSMPQMTEELPEREVSRAPRRTAPALQDITPPAQRPSYAKTA